VPWLTLIAAALLRPALAQTRPPDEGHPIPSEGRGTGVEPREPTVPDLKRPSGGEVELPEAPQEPAAPSDGRLPAPAPVSAPTTSRTRPTVSIRRASQAPTIDGQLDDTVWSTAARLGTFVQERPVPGAPATEATDVSIAYDNQYLFLAIHAKYSDVSIMRANRADRDQISRDDTVTVSFDPFMDGQRGYSFTVNGYGVQADALISNQGGPLGGAPQGASNQGGGGQRFGPIDPTWDALFHSAGHLVEDGWMAELAIPFKSLRYPSRGRGRAHRWGFQVQREIQSKNESAVWAPVSPDVMGFLGQMGVLAGFSDLSTSRNLEILPTVTGVASRSLNTTTGLRANTDIEEGGVSVKYGITSNLTFDFAFNPDFSQIESDTQQINVNQRFPLFYPELRPFFLEGQEIFNVGGPVTIVHTRTIIDPRFGAKVTGKVGKMSVGFLVANDEAPGKVDPTDPAFEETAQFVIGRLRYDLRAESHIGAIVTDREFMGQYSRVAGLDSVFRVGRSQRFIFRTLRSAHRDAAGLATEGHMLDMAMRKEGRHLSFVTAYFMVSPDFKTDAGFVRRTDERQFTTQVQYRWWPQHWIVNWGPRANYNHSRQFNGRLQDHGGGAGVQAQFAKNIFLNAQVERDMERYLDVNFRKTRYLVGGNMNTSRMISFAGYMNWGEQIRFVTNPYLGTGDAAQLFVTARPFSRLQSNLILTRSDFVNTATSLEEFDIKIYRLQTTYQFTPRWLLRNILEYNDYDRTFGANILATYRVNSGTAFFIGYDDRYRQGDRISETLFPTGTYDPVNRAFFAKLQVLLRY